MAEIALRPYQEDGVAGIRAAFREKRKAVLFVLPTGGGKCLGAGTPVLMYDGSIKAVENITVGELLMGPDSKPRRVLSLARGVEEMYRVTPVKGESYVVNESHILSLKRTNTDSNPRYPSEDRGGEIVNVSVLDYMSRSKWFKHIHKGWRVAVDFVAQPTPTIEPYFLGAWLGDGHSHIAHITTGDEEIVQYLIGYAERMGMKIGWHDNSEGSIVVLMQGIKHTGRGGTGLMNRLRFYDLIRNKHIPHCYKTGSRETRLQVLAGLIDTDGSYDGKGYDITLGSERLMDDLIFIARSLGFSAYKAKSRKTCHNNGVSGDYWRCCISGDLDQIPCLLPRKIAAPREQKKDVLATGISVSPIGPGEYFGFEIDGDRLFMLGDFTVTHNTYTFCYIAQSAAERGNNTIIVVHRKELLLQASKSLRALGIDHGLISPHFTPAPHKMVQVASVDTLIIRAKKQPDRYKFKLLVFDEAHHVTAKNKWGTVWELLGRPLTLGVTATPKRGDGIGLGVEHGGIFEEMVIGPLVPHLIGMGMLINPQVYACGDPPDMTGLKKNKDGDYNAQEVAERVDKPSITGSAVEHYKEICPGARAIVFCANIKHARHVAEQFCDAGFKFALLVGEPEMSDAERTAVNKALASGELHGACTVDLVSEGYDLPDLQCCIMLRPTASESLFLQQVGRVMRPSPGKTEAYLLDHVANTGRLVDGQWKVKHGFPASEREWSLEGRSKKKKKAEEEKPIEAKQCKKCYHVFEPRLLPLADLQVIEKRYSWPDGWAVGVEASKRVVCPQCGTDCGPMPRQIEQVDGKLLLIEQAAMAVQAAADKEAESKAKRAEVGKAMTLADFEAIEKQRGYKRGWARRVYDARLRKKEETERARGVSALKVAFTPFARLNRLVDECADADQWYDKYTAWCLQYKSLPLTFADFKQHFIGENNGIS
jgi:superfamily II DNA or RNA helicase